MVSRRGNVKLHQLKLQRGREERSTHRRHEIVLPVGRRRTSERGVVSIDSLFSFQRMVDSTVMVRSVDVGFERLSGEEESSGRGRELIGRELLSSISPHSVGSSGRETAWSGSEEGYCGDQKRLDSQSYCGPNKSS